MTQLTPHFTLDEFKCHDGTAVPADLVPNCLRLATELEKLRETLGKPIAIMSGYRSPAYNKRVGGADKSEHMQAAAADIIVTGLSPLQVQDAILTLIKAGTMYNGGVGIYDGWVHYDVGGKGRRWDFRRTKA
jgi:uncharacterized protein YcbK (DUF882 family)